MSEKNTTIEYGLIGEKLSHSYSKIIHGRLGGYRYDLISLAPEELDAFMKARNFKGLNVTIPYKKAVIPYCDELSPSAKRIGSVNTLLLREGGSLYGHNTDYDGFLYAAKSAGISFAGKKVLVLGSGGTSLTSCAAAEDSGASDVIIVSRNGKCNYGNVYEEKDAEIIINTTPVGMYPQNGASLLDLSLFPHLSGFIDVIYNPLRTATMLQAERLGLPRTSGLPMLVAQAKAAAELFLSRPISDGETNRICSSLLGEITNIVLIGMPGSGKTSIGRAVAKRLERKFVDTDSLVEERAGMSVSEIFSTFGEAHFRRLEREAVADAGKEKGLVISAGGGAVMDAQNRDALRQNGRIYHIVRDLERLARDNRPLSTSLDALKEIWLRREPVYKAAADKTIENNGALSEAADCLMEDFNEVFGY